MTEAAKWDPVAFVSTRPTPGWFEIRGWVYRCGGYNYYEYGGFKDEETFYDPLGDGRNFVSLAQIKAELATREHVPNKKEARKIRQERAKAH
jgi:hypothetical protein